MLSSRIILFTNTLINERERKENQETPEAELEKPMELLLSLSYIECVSF